MLAGWASERFGYKPTMLVALVALTGFLFIQFFAVNLPMLLVGYLLLGVSANPAVLPPRKLIFAKMSLVSLGLLPNSHCVIRS